MPPSRRKAPPDSVQRPIRERQTNSELARLLGRNAQELARKITLARQSEIEQRGQPAHPPGNPPPLDEKTARFMTDSLSSPLPETFANVLAQVREGKAVEGISARGEGFIVKTLTNNGLMDFSFKLGKEGKIIPGSVKVNTGAFGDWQKPNKPQLGSFARRIRDLGIKRW